MLAAASFREERIETVVAAAQRLIGRHLTVRLDAVLQTVQLPASIADLAAGLTNVDGDHFTLQPQLLNRSHSLATHHVVDEFVHAHSKPAVG
jgi:hypothetical protein